MASEHLRALKRRIARASELQQHREGSVGVYVHQAHVNDATIRRALGAEARQAWQMLAARPAVAAR